MKGLLYWLLLALACVFLTACGGTKYVPVIQHETDSIFLSKYQIDTLVEHDSVFIYINGDTVYKYKEKVVYKIHEKVDTFYKEKTDSIPVPYEVQVEKKLSAWEKAKQYLGGYGMVLSVLLTLYLARRVRKS